MRMTSGSRAGALSLGNRTVEIKAILASSGGRHSACASSSRPDPNTTPWRSISYGAIFSEVGVDRVTGEIRVRRMLGVFDAGRILNEKTARSQLMGGMIIGLGAALLEESLMDMRYGSFMNRDLGIPYRREPRRAPPWMCTCWTRPIRSRIRSGARASANWASAGPAHRCQRHLRCDRLPGTAFSDPSGRRSPPPFLTLPISGPF